MSKYKDYTPEQMEELFSNYLMDSWSFSKVSTFSRNEKAFEMSYIYNQSFKRSSSEAAGSAYHEAIAWYFSNLKTGTILDVVDLQTIAFNYIDEIWPNQWKIQKTTPTVEECQKKANTICSALLKNFFSDINVYLSDLEEILDVELYCNEFLTINGVDIPLPCHLRIDLVIRTKKEHKIVVIDHKSKSTFSDDKEVRFSIGRQAITYCKGYESNTGIKVDEVWFIENKYSENKDKKPQLSCFKVNMDEDNRKLYEALLYEPLKRMIEAISDPDHVYIINDNDNFVDKAEIYDFWAQTMIAEVDDFNIPEPKKELIEKRLRKIRNASLATINPNIIKKFRDNAAEFIPYDLSNKNMTKEQKIEHTLRTLGLIVNIAHTFEGYSSDTFLINVSVGTNLSSVQKYRLDIASALDVPAIRMSKDLFVHEGKAYLSIEAPKKREKFLPFDLDCLDGFKIPIGKDNFDNKVIWDMENPSTPHVLICGSTGCLAADTNISCYVPHYKSHSKTKTIETLFKIQNGEPSRQTHLVNRGKKNMLVRCLNEKTNKFEYTPFEVVYSGKKLCFNMVTDAGQTIECTENHKFLSGSKWKPLSKLKVGDKIMYRPPVRNFKGKQKQQVLRDVFVKYHPKGRIKTTIDTISGKPYKYYRVPFHHFVYEANKNGLSVNDYKILLDNYDGRELFFIPKGYQIDHIDGIRQNNDPSNLQMLTIKEHSRKTVDTANGVFGYFEPKECTVLSINPTEIKDTYDICCIGDNHNFLANNLVVHNSGKSVCIISMIEYAKLAGINRIVIFDPKFEFNGYLNSNTEVFNNIEDIETMMELMVEEMNEHIKSGKTNKTLVIFDEFADAVANSRSGAELNVYQDVINGTYKNGSPKFKRECVGVKKSLEENLRILLQKGRSSGYRIVAATQRASVKVITGDAKVNFPVQICFKVPKEIDSKVVLDEAGAESLTGKGDGLIKSPEYPSVVRFQAFYKK